MKKQRDPMTKKAIDSGEPMPNVPGKAKAAVNSTSGNPAAERKGLVKRGKKGKAKPPAKAPRY